MPLEFGNSSEPPIIAVCDFCNSGISAKKLNLSIVDKFKPKFWNNFTCDDNNNNDTQAGLYEQHMEAHFNQNSFEQFDTYVSTNEITNSILYSDEYIRYIMSMPKGPDFMNLPIETQNYMLYIIILIVNNHHWQHKPSCFKKSLRNKFNNNLCRYDYPKERIPTTEYTLEGVVHERHIGNINYIDLLYCYCWYIINNLRYRF